MSSKKGTPINPELVKAVRSYAKDHYEEDGWDFIVEAYTDPELWDLIAGSQSADEAIKKAHEMVSLLNERRSEIRSTAW